MDARVKPAHNEPRGRSPIGCADRTEAMMPFRVSGKNIDVGEALRTRVTARVAEATAKYFDGGFSGHATIEKDGFGFRTECVIHLDSGVVLEVDAFAPDAYASADQAAIRIEKRLRRYKRRRKDRPVPR
jgi:ribosomal subunit interface protein